MFFNNFKIDFFFIYLDRDVGVVKDVGVFFSVDIGNVRDSRIFL